jgi:hypothetical protein
LNADRHGGSRPVYVVLALIAVLALVFAGISGPPAGASGGNTASAAKKKCKKGFKLVKKHGKKKCKKKPVVAAVPLVRATLKWDTSPPGAGANLDLFVFDSTGNSGNPASNSIPQSVFSANALSAPGTETFTDLAPQPARTFTFGVCYGPPDIGSTHAIGTIDYVTADGVHHIGDFDLGSKGGHAEFPVNGVPTTNYCQ